MPFHRFARHAFLIALVLAGPAGRVAAAGPEPHVGLPDLVAETAAAPRTLHGANGSGGPGGGPREEEEEEIDEVDGDPINLRQQPPAGRLERAAGRPPGPRGWWWFTGPWTWTIRSG